MSYTFIDFHNCSSWVDYQHDHNLQYIYTSTSTLPFLIHTFPFSSLTSPVMLILVSVRFENLVIWLFGTDAMRRNLAEAMRRQRGNLPTLIETVVGVWVFGKQHGNECWACGCSASNEGAGVVMRVLPVCDGRREWAVGAALASSVHLDFGLRSTTIFIGI